MLAACQATPVADPLPSWNDGASKSAIVDFVNRVTDESQGDYRPTAERVAVFDNDGTLWAEKPFYFQLAYALDRVAAMAPEHPEWRSRDALRAVIDGDQAAMAEFGLPQLMEIVAASHAGMTMDEFRAAARAWQESAQHPRFNRRYTELTYAPMVELLQYLRDNGFQTWIVSGGGIEFLRVFAEEAYGIPPQQVVGSSMAAEYRSDPTGPTIVKLPEVGSVDDKAVKPVNINLHIGRRPILAFGNSDGDFEMLEYTTTGDGARLGLILHHDDAEREYAYDRESHVGRLVRGLDEAEMRGWIVVSMARDFRTVF
ncbi:MAG: HAD family hydrolase [Planctomycetota bacterium]|jgi:phosphoserine phosphatase